MITSCFTAYLTQNQALAIQAAFMSAEIKATITIYTNPGDREYCVISGKLIIQTHMQTHMRSFVNQTLATWNITPDENIEK